MIYEHVKVMRISLKHHKKMIASIHTQWRKRLPLRKNKVAHIKMSPQPEDKGQMYHNRVQDYSLFPHLFSNPRKSQVKTRFNTWIHF